MSTNDFDLDIPAPAPTPQAAAPSQPTQAAPSEGNAVSLPDVELATRQEGPQNVVQPDEKTLAVKFAVIGAGQGGSRLADTFWKIGYRRVCAINTTNQDFLGLDLPVDKQMVLKADGGAGKDAQAGHKALMDSTEEVMNLMRRCFGDDIDHIIITVGAGGGSGTGAALGLVRLARNYMRAIGKPEKIGMMMTLPKHAEGGTVQANAHWLVEQLLPMTKADAEIRLSPFIVIDNQSINSMFPNVSAKQFWSTANKNAVGLFDIFNVLASQKSAYTTFDRADYRNILDSGLIIYGATQLQSYKLDTDIADGLRNNIKRTLLAEGFDFEKTTHVAAILAAPDAVLEILPQSHIDLAFEVLERTLGGINRKLTMHQGVYETARMGLFCYTMVGGLEFPESRLKILKARAGI